MSGDLAALTSNPWLLAGALFCAVLIIAGGIFAGALRRQDEQHCQGAADDFTEELKQITLQALREQQAENLRRAMNSPVRR